MSPERAGEPAAAVVEIAGERVALGPVREFERWLAAHLEDTGAAPVGDAEHLRETARALGKVLPRMVARPDAARDAIDELLSETGWDGPWRELLAALAPLPGDYDEHRLLALARYRRHILRLLEGAEPPPPAQPAFQSLDRLFDAASVVADPEDLPADEEHPPAASLGEGDGEPLPGAPDDGEPPSEALDLSAPVTPRPAAVVPPAEPRVSRGSPSRRLPRGERVAIDAGDQPLELRLASRSFILKPGPVVTLVDDGGRVCRLKDGRNIVGRVPYADVVIDEGYVDVSRRHLIIDVAGGAPVALTDLSSRGTFVEADRVEALSDP